MGLRPPRVVMVTRESEYELLLARHGTRAQAEFFLKTQGQSIDPVLRRHQRLALALDRVNSVIPPAWRRQRLLRADLDRFLFEPDDTIVVVGQDGLVANTAKYLHGQPVLGINPNREEYDGVLVPFPPDAAADLLAPAVERRARTQSRTMVQARLGDGQTLLALNEVFVGARTHQSARYRIQWCEREERQSSSGIIVASGTGATGWAKSINRERRLALALPAPTDALLAFFVREAFESVATHTGITEGLLRPGDRLTVISEMNEQGVLFADGIEKDTLVFDWGVSATLSLADRRLELVTG
jgi:NAD kinase